MSRFSLSIVAFGLLLAGRSVVAAEFFVSPTGTDRGKGTEKAPWSLVKALSHPGAVKPGDTIWLRGGTYVGTFKSYLRGTSSQPIVVRQYPGERATLDGNLSLPVGGKSKPVLAVQDGAFTWFWGFEVTNSSPVRTDTVPCTHCRGDGIFITAPGTKIINVAIHDAGQGIFCASSAKDVELYGNLIYYNGWKGRDRGHGHGIYIQNYEGGSKLIRHNVLFDGYGYNLHAYGSKRAGLKNSQVDGNVWWRGTSVVGGENGFDIEGTSVTGNFSWSAPLNMGYHTTKCAGVTVSGNYLANLGGGVFSPGHSGCREGETITGNTFVGDLNGFLPGDSPNSEYSSKTYPPTKDKMAILPNAYEPGRATIVIYNWDRSETQAVDLTGIVSLGSAYEIRNAQNFYGTPVVSGTYGEGTVSVPMTGLTPASPVGFEAPPSTGPLFNVFVVLPVHDASKAVPTSHRTVPGSPARSQKNP